MLAEFDDRFSKNSVRLISLMECLFLREMISISCGDEEHLVDFDNLTCHFRGEISDENMKRRCKIELTENIPMEELNK